MNNSAFINFFQKIKSMDVAGDETLFFRGQSNVKYKFQASVFRNAKSNESAIYHKNMVECPEMFSKREHVSNLVKMQHYGSRTRLLDVSINPLVALYFACSGNMDKDGEVFVVKSKNDNILNHTSDRALMIACLPCFNESDQKAIKEFCIAHNGRMNECIIKKSDVMKRFLHEIRNESPAFEPEIIGQDLLNNYVISVFKDNDHIKRQQGSFIFCGLNHKDVDKMIYKRIIIKANDKKEILNDLKLLGITEGTVYGDFSKKLSEIANSF